MIDKSKTYRTRDGREVRVLMTDGGDWHFPVIAAYKDKDRRWWPLHLSRDGKANPFADHNDTRDLIEVKPRIKREVWVNVYPMCQTIWPSEEAANEGCTDYRIACVKLTIDCEEGEGL